MEAINRKQLWMEISDIKKRLKTVESYAGKLKPSKEVSPEEEFRNEFPEIKIDRKLFDLVGIDPYISLEYEKEELTHVITDAYESNKDIS